MRHVNIPPLRAAVLFCGLLLTFAGLTPAAAQTAPPRAGFAPNRLVGEVTNLQGPATGPMSFTLELGYLSVDLHITARTTFVSRSAEAQIEGLANGDYAFVVARRIKRQLVAMRVSFDIQPFSPLREIDGTVVRVNPVQTRLVIRFSANNKILVVRLNRQSRYKTDGRIDDFPPILTRGDFVQVLCLQRNGLIGYEVDVHPGPNGLKLRY